jgi:hypothetical protein
MEAKELYIAYQRILLQVHDRNTDMKWLNLKLFLCEIIRCYMHNNEELLSVPSGKNKRI